MGRRVMKGKHDRGTWSALIISFYVKIETDCTLLHCCDDIIETWEPHQIGIRAGHRHIDLLSDTTISVIGNPSRFGTEKYIFQSNFWTFHGADEKLVHHPNREA